MRKKQGRANPGDGTVYWSDKERRFVAAISLGRDDRGVRVRKRFVGPRGDKSEDARLGLRDRLQQAQRKRPPRKRGARLHPRVTLGEWLEQWLSSKEDELSDSAVANYGWAIDRHIRPGLGATRVADLTRAQIKAFFGKVATLGEGGKKKVRTVLCAALNDAMEHDPPLLYDNPAARLKLKRTKGTPPREIATWNKEEARKFLAAAKRTEYFPLFLLMIVGALGPAEAFAVRWKDVDLENGKVAIVANLTETEGRLVYKEVKVDSRKRTIVLPAIVLKALRERHRRIKPAKSNFCFTAPQGGGIRRTTFGARVWAPLVKKAKVPKITLYGLRHSSASIMAAMGVPLLLASRTLGHSTIKLTADTYSHLFEEAQREVAAKFESFLKGL